MALDNRGRQIPFFVGNYTYEDIRTVNFDPITNGTDAKGTLTASGIGKYSQKGFLVRPDTDGVFYGITWESYKDNKLQSQPVLTGLTPQKFLGLANTWIECPMIKVYAKNDGTYPNVSSYINVAPL